MKKKIAFFLLSVFLLVSAVACFDKKDFAFDKFSTSNIEPTLHIPLFRDSIFLAAGTNIKYEGDLAALYFPVSNIALPDTDELFSLPGASATGSGNLAAPGTLTLPVLPLAFSFTNGELIDSIHIQQLSLRLTVNAAFSSTYTLSFPGLKPAASLTLVVPAGTNTTVSGSISGCLALVNDAIQVVPVIASSVGSGNFSFRLELLSGDALQAAFGYFGQHIKNQESKISIGAFDKISGTCDVEAAYFALEATNATGVPVALSLQKIQAGSPKAGTVTVNDVGTVTVAAATQPGATVKTQGRIGGPMLSDFVNKLISGNLKDAYFTFSSTTNPGGNNPAQRNFIVPGAALNAGGEVIIPLKLAMQDLLVVDTLAIQFPQYEIKSMGAKLHTENYMPVSLDLQAVLLDSTGKVMYKTSPAMRDTLFVFPYPVSVRPADVDLSTGLAIAPRVQNFDLIPMDTGTVKNLKKARFLQIRLEVKSPGAAADRKVRIVSGNYVNVRVGVEAQVKYDDIKDDF